MSPCMAVVDSTVYLVINHHDLILPNLRIYLLYLYFSLTSYVTGTGTMRVLLRMMWLSKCCEDDVAFIFCFAQGRLGAGRFCTPVVL